MYRPRSSNPLARSVLTRRYPRAVSILKSEGGTKADELHRYYMKPQFIMRVLRSHRVAPFGHLYIQILEIATGDLDALVPQVYVRTVRLYW